MENRTPEDIALYASKAVEYLASKGITENGYGYAAVPVSAKIRSAIDSNYLTVFIDRVDFTPELERDTAFIVSKTFSGEQIKVQKKHMGLAIGTKGANISRLVKKLDRRITYVGV